jgi:hypothetical protein
LTDGKATDKKPVIATKMVTDYAGYQTEATASKGLSQEPAN